MKKLILFTAFIFGLLSFKESSKGQMSASYYGIDVSQYQGDINWKEVRESKPTINFVILRATMGTKKDTKFKKNMKGARKNGFNVGAYHYYNPNISGQKQAKNYLATVKLRKGDIIPIVDLERLSTNQSTKKLKLGLKKWLDAVEKEYGVKPMIYSGASFYKKHLSKDFAEYPSWIAAYSKSNKSKAVENATIHQFSEKKKVKGIKGKVDGNKTSKKKLASVTLKK
jgi:lysozyme